LWAKQRHSRAFEDKSRRKNVAWQEVTMQAACVQSFPNIRVKILGWFSRPFQFSSTEFTISRLNRGRAFFWTARFRTSTSLRRTSNVHLGKAEPTAESIFGIIKVLQESEHVRLQVKAAKKAALPSAEFLIAARRVVDKEGGKRSAGIAPGAERRVQQGCLPGRKGDFVKIHFVWVATQSSNTPSFRMAFAPSFLTPKAIALRTSSSIRRASSLSMRYISLTGR
jgi:hypothetical protein